MKNAADEAQVKRSVEREKSVRERELMDLKILLSSPEGRRFIWRLMGKAKVFESVWEQSAKIHYNAGQQDFGHFLMAEVVEADQKALFLMMQESKKKEENENG